MGLGVVAPAAAVAATQPTITLDPVAPLALELTGAQSPQLDWTFHRNLGFRAVDIKVDARGLAKVGKIAFSGECTAHGLVADCSENWPVDGTGMGGSAPFTVTPFKGVKLGTTGGFTVSGSAPGLTVRGGSGVVTVGGPAYDLAPLARFRNQKVGAVVSQPITFDNAGNRPANGSDVALVLSPGLRFTQHYGNCRYRSDVQGGVRVEDAAVCHFRDWMRIGEKVAFAQPVRTQVTPRALWTYMDVMAAPAGSPSLAWATSSQPSSRWTQGRGPALGLKRLVAGKPSAVPAGTAQLQRGDQGYGIEWVSAHNWADYGVTGSSAKAPAGHDVTMSFSVTNHGPAVLYDRSGGEATPFVKLTAPAGTTVVGSPECGNQPQNGVWYCSAGMKAILSFPGDTYHFTITFHVVTVVPHARGEVQLVWGGGPTPSTNLPFDPNPKNNTAGLILN
ncbi:hypothetical protein DN069_14710 [Streptacidiphilus pinicola]|uniref:Uncharacterized protein n=1 Tax=Streptacidiphilus pinicola TaxID=2219663 RepID=A0A2X0IIB1_9ACTN|nr:hypothetical protein DN069_14710 [Streptacidiphilus pinicola]